uniref:Uncharacterized protein n=1 Tax=Vespula pensylvanica TaxID=30213 RepID=A0A834NLW8_VESPE|nr:hypothetical protein H0235_012894 [Vespula pensylvanica]
MPRNTNNKVMRSRGKRDANLAVGIAQTRELSKLTADTRISQGNRTHTYSKDFPAISTRKDRGEEETGTLDYRLRTWYAFGLSTLPCMDYQSPLEI